MDFRTANTAGLRTPERLTGLAGDSALSADNAGQAGSQRDFADLLRAQQADRQRLVERQMQDRQLHNQKTQDRQQQQQDQLRARQDREQALQRNRQAEQQDRAADDDRTSADTTRSDQRRIERRTTEKPAVESVEVSSPATEQPDSATTPEALKLATRAKMAQKGVDPSAADDSHPDGIEDAPEAHAGKTPVETKQAPPPTASAAQPAVLVQLHKAVGVQSAELPEEDSDSPDSADDKDESSDSPLLTANTLATPALPAWQPWMGTPASLTEAAGHEAAADTLHTFLGDPSLSAAGAMGQGGAGGVANAVINPEAGALPGSGRGHLSPYQQAMMDNVNLSLQADAGMAAESPAADSLAPPATQDTDSRPASPLSSLPAGLDRTGLATAANGLPPPVAHAMTGRLAAQIVWMQSQHLQRADLRLSPDELGSLHIQLDLSRDQTVVNVSAAHAQVRDWLHANGDQLRQLMQDAGLQLAGYHVSEHSPEYTQQQGFGRQSDGQPGGDEPQWRIIGADPADEGDVAGPVPVQIGLGLVDSYA